MSPKKSKEKLKYYADTQKEIFKYIGKHDFHKTITEMMFKTYVENCDDPFQFMIEYLLEKKGRKLEDFANESLKLENEEKDKTIRILTDKVTYLEELIKNEQLTTNASNLIGTQTFKNNAASTISNTSLLDLNSSMLATISNLNVESNEKPNSVKQMKTVDESIMTSNGKSDDKNYESLKIVGETTTCDDLMDVDEEISGLRVQSKRSFSDEFEGFLEKSDTLCMEKNVQISIQTQETMELNEENEQTSTGTEKVVEPNEECKIPKNGSEKDAELSDDYRVPGKLVICTDTEESSDCKDSEQHESHSSLSETSSLSDCETEKKAAVFEAEKQEKAGVFEVEKQEKAGVFEEEKQEKAGVFEAENQQQAVDVFETTTVSAEIETSNFDDFEPDYEPDDE